MGQGTIDRTTIKGIRRNFFPYPLKGDELNEETGLYVNTIEARTGSPVKSPIEDIFEACTENDAKFIHLLLGHRGCGKSTEINRLEIKFKNEGFAVRKIDCRTDANSANLKLEDVLILITNALLDICNEKGININPNDVETLKSFFVSIEKEEKIGKSASIEVNAGIGAGFSKIIKLIAEVKSKIMNTSDEMITIRETIIKRFSEWNVCIDNIIEKIKEKDDQKYPIIIFENFDKIVPTERAIEIFKNGYLEDIRTYIIYTFPISLSYDARFRTITQCASPHIFPMIDVKKKNGEKNDTGYDTIKKIIEKRAELTLFEEDALNLLIEKTGGSLRDVFNSIEQAAKYTYRKGKDKICTEEVNMALDDVKYNYLSRVITMKDYPALNEIHRTKSEIKDDEAMLRFLEAHVVLEYNGTRWHDLHPLIYDFLKENGRIEQ
jgi:hypothetical protein